MSKVEDFFTIEYGNFSTPIQQLEIGTIPLVSSSGQNNGVVGFFDIEPLYQNVISVARTGSVGETFYHNYPCVINSDCMVLFPKKNFSTVEIYWFVFLITKYKSRFSYSRKVTPTRLGKIIIPDEIPEWVKSINWNVKCDFPEKHYLNTGANLNTEKWNWFKYDEIFELKKGERIVNNEIRVGKTPCIRPIESNNGVYKFIDLKPNHPENTITVNYNGSVAEAFYQPNPFFALDDVNILYPKFELNPYIAMFLITLIRKEKYRFNYGRKWHLGRMNESLIKLPVNELGQPDFEFMESYIKSLPYSSNLG